MANLEERVKQLEKDNIEHKVFKRVFVTTLVGIITGLTWLLNNMEKLLELLRHKI